MYRIFAEGLHIQDHRAGNNTFRGFPGYKEIKEFSYKKKFIKIYALE